MTLITRLKQSEYKEGAKITFENFEELIKITDKAAEIGNYGIASSLCILALEELTKSVILQLKSINNSIPIKNLDKYFKCHETKQNASIEIFLTLKSRYQDDNDVLNDNENIKFSLTIVIAAIALLIIGKLNTEKKETKKTSKSYLDAIKESGFYVGYDESLRQWKSPKSQHNREGFNELFQYINEFAEEVRNWIFNEKINKENIIEFLYSFSDEIIDKKQLDKMK